MKVTIYIKAGANIQKWINRLNQELVLARNIKDKATGQQVGAALKSLKDTLRTVSKKKDVRKNGIVLFADGSNVYMEVPPQPMNFTTYYCGNDFLDEPLYELQDIAKGPWTGIVVVDAREASVGIGRGEAVIGLGHAFSSVMGKHRAGGQSSQRFQRGHDEQLKEWRRKVASMAKSLWEGHDIKSVVIAGPGFEKQRLAEEIKGYDIRLVASEYCDEVYGLKEAWERSKQ